MSFLVLCLALVPGPTPQETFDWPCWRGAKGDNVSRESQWSSVGRSEPLWRVRIGSGYSSPAVLDGRLYVTGYEEAEATPGEGQDRVACLDATSGEVVWEVRYPARAFANEHGGGVLSTPTVLREGDATTVYVASRSGEVRALRGATGEELWRVDLVARHEVQPGRYGFASSPLVEGARLVLNAGRPLALERATGETAWIADDLQANYATVAPIELGGERYYSVFGGEGLVLVDAADGRRAWSYPFRKSPRNVEAATPIVVGTTVIASSAYDQGIARVDFAGLAPGDAPHEVWRSRGMRNKMAGCTLFEGHLYGFDESMLKCLDLAGEEQWRVRGLGQGALSVAGGRLLVTTSRGELIVAAAAPDEFREAYRSPRLFEDGVFWTAPVLVNGRILVRSSLGELVCLDHRTTAQERPVDAVSAAGSEAPDARALVARHLEVTGLGERARSPFRATGKLDVHAMGLADVDAMVRTKPGLWHARFGLPPAIGGSIDRYFDGELAWETNPYRGDSWIEEGPLEELRRTNGQRTLFEPIPAGGRVVDVVAAAWDRLPCHRVDVEVAPERVRRLYFERATGRLIVREGRGEATYVYEDWRDVEGAWLPFRWKVFADDTGLEERWRFHEASFEDFQLAPEIPASLLEESSAEDAGGR